MRPLIEVCVEGLRGALIAIGAGADRLEINSSLAVAGLTPAIDDCVKVKQDCDIPLIAMLRPHAHGFVYDRAARGAILQDLARLVESGVDGVAFGALTPHGVIDRALMNEVRERSAGRVLVMHRAFDELGDQATGLEQLVELGVDRVLTSGGASTAEAGVEQLRKLFEQSRGRIEILPGAGVGPNNALDILQTTGCRQLHGTFKQAGLDSILPCAQTIAAVKNLWIDG